MQLYGYDNGEVGDSHLTSITDALNRKTRFEYDYLGRVTKVTLPDPDTTVLDDVPVYQTTYDNLDRVTTQIDPLGNETVYVSVGRLNPATDRQVGPAGVMMLDNR